MRLDRIVILWQNTTWNQFDTFFLFQCKLQPGFINSLVQVCLAAQPTLRFRSANELEDRFVTNQRLAGPVAADLRKQAMLNRIPLGGASGQLGHGDGQAKFIRQLLQLVLPVPATIAIRIAAIRLNQQFMRVRGVHLSGLHPPASNGCHRELRGLVRGPHHHEPLVARHVVNPEGDRHTVSITGKIILQYGASLPPPGASRILEIPDQFAFLRIHADHRLAGFEKAATQPDEVAHLPVTLRSLLFGQPLTIDADRIILFLQQPTPCDKTNFETLRTQGSCQRAQRLACPFEASDRVACRGLLQQPLQDFQDPGLFFSIAGRPAPPQRTRPTLARSVRWTSTLPRQMVLRLSPVISINRAMPPCPHCSASSPTKRRRFFSSRPATTRLIAWCSLATAL